MRCSTAPSPKPAIWSGDSFTLADINLLPILFYLDKLPESRVMLRDATSLDAYYKRHMERASVEETTPPPFPGRSSWDIAG